MREESGAERSKFMVEINLMQDKIHQLTTMCDNLPPQVRICESNVKTVEDKCLALMAKIDETINRSVEINTSKWGVAQQENYEAKIKRHLMKIEKNIDKGADHCDSLQNWMDVYMPMRL